MIMLRDKKTSAEKSYWLPLPLPQFFTPLQQCRYTNKTLSTCNWDVKYVNSLYLVLSFIVNIIWLSMHIETYIWYNLFSFKLRFFEYEINIFLWEAWSKLRANCYFRFFCKANDCLFAFIESVFLHHNI